MKSHQLVPRVDACLLALTSQAQVGNRKIDEAEQMLEEEENAETEDTEEERVRRHWGCIWPKTMQLQASM